MSNWSLYYFPHTDWKVDIAFKVCINAFDICFRMQQYGNSELMPTSLLFCVMEVKTSVWKMNELLELKYWLLKFST